jgi:hypothetical protein
MHDERFFLKISFSDQQTKYLANAIDNFLVEL